MDVIATYPPTSSKCPFCFHAISPDWDIDYICRDERKGDDAFWFAFSFVCPNCNEPVVEMALGLAELDEMEETKFVHLVTKPFYAVPNNRAPRMPSKEIPEPYSTDFLEASRVIDLSPKASAAVSRRNLQHLIREVAGVKKSDLYHEIQDLLDKGDLPSHIADSLHSVRVVGNFAAHPEKSERTGEVIGVEIGEAEWLLDTLESLFDFYFVQPYRANLRKEALNKKLVELGKPPIGPK